jgi:hypothetical protein
MRLTVNVEMELVVRNKLLAMMRIKRPRSCSSPSAMIFR